MIGQEMHDLMKVLFPICRSLTGNGNRDTLANLRQHIPLKMYEVPSGTKCFDWTVPPEWNCRAAFLDNEDMEKIVDFKNSNLHVVGYSEPIDKWMSFQKLKPHLHYLIGTADAIPYVTSYYKRDWGFCLRYSDYYGLDYNPDRGGRFYAYIDSTLDDDGYLTYADLVIPGKSKEEVLISTYICHPSLANDNLSGPVVSTFLAKWLLSEPRRYTYRFVFVPETIGAIVYLSQHIHHLKENVIAGFQVTCVGDDRAWSYLPSRTGNTLSDRVGRHILGEDYREYRWADRGSDERQWCAPGVDLPITSVMRSKYATYPEYHTSKDDLTFVTPIGLACGYEVLKQCIETLEMNYHYWYNQLGEPQMSKRGLYTPERMDVLTYCDGRSLLEIAEVLGKPIHALQPIIGELLKRDLIAEARL